MITQLGGNLGLTNSLIIQEMSDEEYEYRKERLNIANRIVKDDPNPQYFRELDNDLLDYFAAENGFMWSSEVNKLCILHSYSRSFTSLNITSHHITSHLFTSLASVALYIGRRYTTKLGDVYTSDSAVIVGAV